MARIDYYDDPEAPPANSLVPAASAVVVDVQGRGEVRQEFSVCVACELVGGDLTTSSESHEVAWCTEDDIRALPMHDRIRVRVLDYLAGKRAEVA